MEEAAVAFLSKSLGKSMKRLYILVVIGLVYAVLFGVAVPWLISAPSTLAFAGGVALAVLSVLIPVHAVYNLYRKQTKE